MKVEVKIIPPIKCPNCGEWWHPKMWNWCPRCSLGMKVKADE